MSEISGIQLALSYNVLAEEHTMSKYKKPSPDGIKKKLSAEQYAVTQEGATERPFQNAYWDNKKDGIYVDVVTGEPLFSSLDKFDSGTGWPSFSKPIDHTTIKSNEDISLPFEKRTEIRSSSGDSHLGHVFNDGPSKDGLRYCVNSSSLRFVPVEDLEKEGYGLYRSLFVLNETYYETAILAGGCFWGMEEILKDIPGVVKTTVGYTGGTIENPTYEDVKTGKTNHAEAIEVVYDNRKLSYESVLLYFFRMHDPTTLNKQGHDVGSQYRSAIFYTSSVQEGLAKKVRTEVEKSGKWKQKIVTEIVPALKFYPAEEYHQKYIQKNPGGYSCHYLR